VARLVFLVEEESMADLLDGLLPRLYPGLSFLCVPHQGKQDLERSLSRKLRAWREPGVRFVVMRDQNTANCREVKASLVQLCDAAGRTDSLVRVICRELEAWYIGAPGALEDAFPERRGQLSRALRRRRYRNPDSVVRPGDALGELIPGFRKRLGARRMAIRLDRDNTSRSYQVFLAGVERIWATMQAEEA